MKRILLIGGYGYQDLGDEAQLTAVIENLQHFIPDAHLTILTDNLENTKKHQKDDLNIDFSLKYCMNSFSFIRQKNKTSSNENKKKSSDATSIFSNYLCSIILALKFLILILNAQLLKKNKRTFFLNYTLLKFLKTLKKSDMLFCVGGGTLTSVWRSELYHKSIIIILCRIFEKPIILSGQTIGPFYGFFDRILARYSINQVNLITLRERFSTIILKNLGVTKPIIRITADDSITLASESYQRFEYIIKREGIDLNHPLIGINVIGLRYLQKNQTKIEKVKIVLAKVADKLIDEHDARVLFVPIQYGVDGDGSPAIDVLQLMCNKNKAFVLSKMYDAKQIKCIIDHLDFVIGFRYHFNVFALTSGVPAIGIYIDDYYKIKINGIFDLFGQLNYSINVENVNYDLLMTLINDVQLKKSNIYFSAIDKTKILKQRSLTSIRFAKKLFNKN
ncbi:MAG: polysaccharide pyruvyl transferase family protein [Candidatus Bathyarchaeota archaeon]|nr:MAG: polysaccharide pyruvyl transferase family protein [Candidatus Bathyarchaeota archaeon]